MKVSFVVHWSFALAAFIVGVCAGGLIMIIAVSADDRGDGDGDNEI